MAKESWGATFSTNTVKRKNRRLLLIGLHKKIGAGVTSAKKQELNFSFHNYCSRHFAKIFLYTFHFKKRFFFENIGGVSFSD